MSHFSVLVAVKSPDDVPAALQPYHEFECTGKDDQYVIDVDQTDEARKAYTEETVTRLKAPDGTLRDPYDDEFYRDLTPEEYEKHNLGFAGTGCGNGMSWTSKDWGDGRGYRAKIHLTPANFEEVKVPRSQVETFTQYIDGYYGKSVVPFGEQPDLETVHKFGYVLVDDKGEVVKVIDRTNPNKKWDWWSLGGRYQGRLLVKENAIAVSGRPGLMGASSGRGGVDACYKRDLDLNTMKQTAVKERLSSWRSVKTAAMEAGLTLSDEELDDLRRKFYRQRKAEQDAWKAAWKVRKPDDKFDRREMYRTFMGPELIKLESVFVDVMWDRSTDYDGPIGDWIDAAPPFSAFAVLKDGHWFEKGHMGRWGVVHDEKEGDVWEREVSKMVDDLPDDTWIAIVGCHI